MSNIRAMDDVETRTVLSLRTGTKICVLVGLAFIALAVYFFVVPVTSVRTTSGSVFGCGTALDPAHGSFANGVCGRVADANRYRAFLTLAIGLVTIIVGALMFGFDRREEQRQIPRDHHLDADEDDRRRDPDWADAPRTRRERFAADDAGRGRGRDENTERQSRRYDYDAHDDQHYDRDDERSSRRRDHRYDDRDDEGTTGSTRHSAPDER